MITKENISHVLDALTKDQISNVFESGADYFCLWLGGYGEIYFDPIHSNCISQGEQCAEETGGVFGDLDTFLMMFKESESINPFIIELI